MLMLCSTPEAGLVQSDNTPDMAGISQGPRFTSLFIEAVVRGL